MSLWWAVAIAFHSCNTCLYQEFVETAQMSLAQSKKPPVFITEQPRWHSCMTRLYKTLLQSFIRVEIDNASRYFQDHPHRKINADSFLLVAPYPQEFPLFFMATFLFAPLCIFCCQMCTGVCTRAMHSEISLSTWYRSLSGLACVLVWAVVSI